jgi:hypothetical protein
MSAALRSCAASVRAGLVVLLPLATPPRSVEADQTLLALGRSLAIRLSTKSQRLSRRPLASLTVLLEAVSRRLLHNPHVPRLDAPRLSKVVPLLRLRH